MPQAVHAQTGRRLVELRARTATFSMPAAPSGKPQVRAPAPSLRRAVSSPNLSGAAVQDGPAPAAESDKPQVGATQSGSKPESVTGMSTSSLDEASKDHTIGKKEPTDAMVATTLPASPETKRSASSFSKRGGGLKAFLSKASSAKAGIKSAVSNASPKLKAFIAKATKEFDSSRLILNALVGAGGQPGLIKASIELGQNIQQSAAPMANRALEMGSALADFGAAVATFNPAMIANAGKELAKELKPTSKDQEMHQTFKNNVADFKQNFGAFETLKAQIKEQRAQATPAA
jgi:hypothetical protein